MAAAVIRLRGMVADRAGFGTRVATWEGVSDVSTRLRRARERKGLRIEDISVQTKIKPAFLQAIEMGHFETLPGHFFTRAFIKSYAREVGLAPEEVVRDFDLVHGTPAVEVEQIAAAVEVKEQRSWGNRADSFQLPTSSWQFAAVAVIVLVALSFLNRPETTGASGPAPVGTTGVAADVPAASPPEIVAPQKLTVQIRPRGVIWVNATADGAVAVYKLLQPGQHVTVEGRELSFRIGNAAAFDYSINGDRGKPIGGPDEVREFQITPANYRNYIR